MDTTDMPAINSMSITVVYCQLTCQTKMTQTACLQCNCMCCVAAWDMPPPIPSPTNVTSLHPAANITQSPATGQVAPIDSFPVNTGKATVWGTNWKLRKSSFELVKFKPSSELRRTKALNNQTLLRQILLQPSTLTEGHSHTSQTVEGALSLTTWL